MIAYDSGNRLLQHKYDNFSGKNAATAAVTEFLWHLRRNLLKLRDFASRSLPKSPVSLTEQLLKRILTITLAGSGKPDPAFYWPSYQASA
ncbi:hypothetical protein [Comamonas sp.]|uniref:hypothetical protein n=1 Tax=Comamonas sp. TaxID=34028 RepID=UPI002899CAFD|nr:hypothetical protein [Comamonas sp.]